MEIQRVRRERKLRQDELAKLADLDVATVANLERGRGRVESLVVVLAALEHEIHQQGNGLKLGRWLSERRLLAGWSLRRLAQRASCSKPSVMKIERTRGSLATLAAIMNALSVVPLLRPIESNTSERAKLMRDFIVGDCIEQMRSIPPGFVNLILTSPPFNIGKDYGVYKDKLPHEEYERFTRDWMSMLPGLLAPNGALWVVVGHTFDALGSYVPLSDLYIRIGAEFGLILKKRVIWAAPGGRPQTNTLTSRTQDLLWFVKDKDDFVFNLDDTRIPHQTKDRRSHPLGSNPSDLWVFPTVVYGSHERTEHPCQFPVALAERIIRLCSHKGHLILDPFSGVGTTGIAAALNGRGFIGIEIDPRWVNESISRLAREEGRRRLSWTDYRRAALTPEAIRAAAASINRNVRTSDEVTAEFWRPIHLAAERKLETLLRGVLRNGGPHLTYR